jgi:hypothetical protein
MDSAYRREHNGLPVCDVLHNFTKKKGVEHTSCNSS